jgi:filamentous hemagglutinin family protein
MGIRIKYKKTGVCEMKTNIFHFYVTILVCFVCTPLLHAQDLSKIQVTDHAKPLEVGDNDTIRIEQSYGEQKGINQFLKFDAFDIDKGQTAHFIRNAADTHLQNVISRVFGSKASNIDGTIQSDFPNFYILNPAGIIFGPHASLNIPGSFHASTAHYIRGNDAETKFGMNAESNVFMDHPAAFGFINSADFGSIEIQGLGEYDPIGEYDPELFTPGLSVEAGQTISLIGGDIEFEQGDYYYDDTDKLINPETLYANAGRINLVSVKSAHEVPLQHIFKVDSIDEISGAHSGDIAIVSSNDQVDTYQYNENSEWIQTNDLTTIPGVKIGEMNSQVQFGNIMANDRTRLAVDKFTQAPDPNFDYQSRSGEIMIKGGQIFLDKTRILSQNCSDENGGNIDIQGKSIMLRNDSFISTEVARDRENVNNETTYIDGKGNGGDIIISGNDGNQADAVMLFRSMISTGTKSLDSEAASGKIDIKARNISLLSSFQITDSVFDSYENTLPDDIREKLFELKNIDYTSKNAFISALSNILTDEEINNNLSSIFEGLQVGSAIYSDVNGYGQGGDISLNALESLNILRESKIYANAKNKDDDAGNAGNITINARTIILTELNAEISSQTLGPGEGGNISLYADDSITVNEFASIRAETGSNSSGTSVSTKDNANAGNILIDAPRVSILKGGIIESSTYVKVNDQINKGRAGNITIIADDLIHLSGADVVDADASSIRNRSQNTATNAGRGGKVLLTAREIKFEDGAFIGSETYGGGDGGDVELIATDKIHFSGTDNAGYACKIYTNSSFANSTSTGEQRTTAGKAGNIRLEATNLIRLEDGAGVTASTLGPGPGGSVSIENTQKMELIGGNPHGENEDGFASGIFARSAGKGRYVGDADSISIKVDDLIITGGAVVSNSTLGAGNAGDESSFALDLNIKKQLIISGEGEAPPQEDQLSSQINFNRMYSSEGDYRSGIYSTSESTEPYAGKAGKIKISTPTLQLSDRATISTATKGAGEAGNIELNNVIDISLTSEATISSASFSDSNIQHFVVDDLDKVDALDISNGDIVTLQKNNAESVNYYYKKGADNQVQWIELNSYNDTMTKYSFRIFTISDENPLTSIIPEKGDVAIDGDTYYYFYQVWKEYSGILKPEDIPAFMNNDIFSYTYRQGDISQLVYIDDNINKSLTYNDKGAWEALPENYNFADNHSDYFNQSGIDTQSANLISFIDDRTRQFEQYLNNGSQWKKLQYDGDAGEIHVLRNEQLKLTHAGTSISTSTYGRGDAGLIEIGSLNIQLDDHSEISSASQSTGNGGNAGQINLGNDALDIQLLDISTSAQINTSTEGLGDAGNIVIFSKEISMKTEGAIASSSNAPGDSGNAGNIIIHAGSLSLIHENTSVNTSTYGQGKAGNIDLLVKNLDLDQKASISSASNSIGNGGDAGVIRIGLAYQDNTNPDTKADKPWHITEPSDKIRVINGSSISTASAGAGKAGIVLLGAKNIDVHQSASISSANSSVADIIYFKEKVEQIENLTDRIGAVVEVADDGQGNPKTYIYTGKGNTYGWEEKTKLSLNRVENIAALKSLNVDPGDVAKVADAGDGYSKNFVFDGADWQPIDSVKTVQVYIRKTTNDLSPNIDDKISAEKGDILYTTSNSSYYICENNTWNPIQEPTVSKNFQIDSNGPITKIEDIPDTLISKGDRVNEYDTKNHVRIDNTWEQVYKAGNAGNINIIAENEISLQNNGSLNTEAISSGGGKISIEGKDTLYLFQGLITASVQKGFGAGGDINTRSNSVLMNHSGIEANAVEGDGGAIFIKTEQYIKSNDSYVTATSERGNDGTVKIDAPKVDISKGLVVLPANFLDATRWVKTPCALRSGESVSRLVLEGRDAIPTSLIDWQPSPPLDVTDIKKSEKKKKSSRRNHPTLLKSKNNLYLKKDLTLN